MVWCSVQNNTEEASIPSKIPVVIKMSELDVKLLVGRTWWKLLKPVLL